MSEYGFIFSTKGECRHSDLDLVNLAGFMSGYGSLPDGRLKSMLLPPESDAYLIPAGYTYLGQFIDHDLTFDSRSDRTKPADRPWAVGPFSDRTNQRQKWLELETIYGAKNEFVTAFPYFKIGRTNGLNETPPSTARDYPCDHDRDPSTAMAIIGDPRNDENLIVSQLSLLFMKFHNANVKRFEATEPNQTTLFERAKRSSIRHFQHIVLHDYLPRIVRQATIDSILGGHLSLGNFLNKTRLMPYEFVAAGFRFGHSMIRNSYHFNAGVDPSLGNLRNFMMFTGPGSMNGNSNKKLPSLWVIDWTRFFKINDQKELNFAEPIDTFISTGLLTLRPAVADNEDGRATSLAAIDLFRGQSVGLPSGEQLADQLNVPRLTESELDSIFSDRRVRVSPSFETLRETFSGCTPLWFYILAEAETRGMGRLAGVGEQIVASVILGALNHSDYSILSEPLGQQEDDLAGAHAAFGMNNLIDFVQSKNQEFGRELYPDMDSFDERNPLGD